MNLKRSPKCRCVCVLWKKRFFNLMLSRWVFSLISWLKVNLSNDYRKTKQRKRKKQFGEMFAQVERNTFFFHRKPCHKDSNDFIINLGFDINLFRFTTSSNLQSTETCWKQNKWPELLLSKAYLHTNVITPRLSLTTNGACVCVQVQ